jgi:hypothetical protein
MRLWKRWYALVEPRVNHVLLASILVCLVILLTYLLGGAGAFTIFQRMVQANSAAPPVVSGSSGTPGAGSTTNTTTGNPGALPTLPLGVGGALTVALQIAPLDIAYNCALGASAAQAITLTNPDSVAHQFSLSWNGAASGQSFAATVQQVAGQATDTVAAHGSRSVTITAFTQLALNPNPTSQYLRVSDTTSGPAHVVATVHVWCATPPPVIPTDAVTTAVIPTIALTPPLP